MVGVLVTTLGPTIRSIPDIIEGGINRHKLYHLYTIPGKKKEWVHALERGIYYSTLAK